MIAEVNILPIMSTSKGNLWKLTFRDCEIILDAGWKASFPLMGREVLLTHFHQDHSRHHREFRRRGAKIIFGESIDREDFRVKPVSVLHDTECYGYIISHKGLRVGYIVDCCDFPDINCDVLILGVNHDEETLARHIADGMINLDVGMRMAKWHLSLEKAKKRLRNCEVSIVIIGHYGDRLDKSKIEEIPSSMLWDDIREHGLNFKKGERKWNM